MHRKGFTLLELIVVCALIGLMLAVGAPSLRDAFFHDPLKTASRKIIGFINDVRESAVSGHQSYIVHFGRTKNKIWYEKDRGGGGAGSGDKDEKRKDDHVLMLPETVEISEIWTRSKGVFPFDFNEIWVSKRGYMDQLILHLADDDGRVMSLHFSPFLEVVRVFDKYTPAE